MARTLDRRTFVTLGATLAATALAGCASSQDSPSSDEAATTSEESFVVDGIDYSQGTHHATLEIENYGTIKLELFATNAPITVTNFARLCSEQFYDGLTFHRIIKGFMMQGGDPNANGTGGSGTTIVGEFEDNGRPNPIKHERGVISMARSSAPDSASSQFFIMQQAASNLDGQYAAFGRVTEGMDVVDDICNTAQPLDNNGTIAADAQPRITSLRMDD